MPEHTVKRVRDKIMTDVILDWRDRDFLRNKLHVQIRLGRANAFFQYVDDQGVRRRKSLHVAVAERHIPKPGPEYTVVEALDGNKLNCTVDNLEWRTRDDTDYKRRIEQGVKKTLNYPRKFSKEVTEIVV